MAVGQQHGHRARQHRDGGDEQEGGDQPAPGEEGQLHHGHARARRLKMVTMMLIDPMIDETPRIWTAKMAKSTPMPPCTDSGA